MNKRITDDNLRHKEAALDVQALRLEEVALGEEVLEGSPLELVRALSDTMLMRTALARGDEQEELHALYEALDGLERHVESTRWEDVESYAARILRGYSRLLEEMTKVRKGIERLRARAMSALSSRGS